MSHPHRALRKSVFSLFQQSDCGRRVSVNYGSPSPFDGKTDENTSRHASRSFRSEKLIRTPKKYVILDENFVISKKFGNFAATYLPRFP